MDFGSVVSALSDQMFSYTPVGLVMDKYQQDRAQENMYEASDKELANSKELFGLQQAENKVVRDENRQTAMDMWKLNTSQELSMWEKEKAYQTELWDKANAYNTPKAQMARLTEAGLNPALMYGQGTTGNTTVIKSPDLDSPHVDTVSRDPARYGSASAFAPAYRGQSLYDYIAIRNGVLSGENIKKQNDIMSEQERLMKTNADNAEYEFDYKKSRGISDKDWFGTRLMKDAGSVLGNLWREMLNGGQDDTWHPLDLQYNKDWESRQKERD